MLDSDQMIGTIVEACANNVQTFAAGGVLFQVPPFDPDNSSWSMISS